MKIEELQSLIDKADQAYYTAGAAIMEDARYDKLKDELRALNPSDPRFLKVGFSVRDTILQKKSHTIPMGSQGKAMNEGEFKAWFSNNIGHPNTILHASYKMDGGSLSLEYRDGRLVSAVSRGDGLVGEDITANACKFKGVPFRCMRPDGKLFSGFVRGEVVLTTSDWKKVDLDQTTNPRNLAVGIARRKDGTNSEDLRFYSFRVFDIDGEPYGDSEYELSHFMTKLGFDVAPYMTGKYDDVWAWYLKIQKERPSLPYWIDGIVVKLNDLERQISLGESGGCPKGQIAVKFDAEGAVTTLRDVTIQVGATGAIVPVANFDAVRIGGTTIVNATLCNWENIATLGVCVGDDIYVIKAGDIIPRVMEVTKKGLHRQPIPEPTRCPVCGGKVGRKSNVGGDESTAIYCINEQCPAVITGKIDRYLSSLDIQGIGESLIEAVVKEMGVRDPSDLYLLHKHRDWLANLTLNGKVRFGEKRADHVLEEIEKKRTLTLSEFLGSLGIFGLGKRRVTLIQEALPEKLDTLDDWFGDTLTKYATEAGVPNIADRIHTELLKQKDMIYRCIANGVVISKPLPRHTLKPGAFLICITGALSSPKSYYQGMIEKAGHGYTDTFSKSVNYLVAADPNSGSGKLKKATKMGTKVISEEELLKILGQ